MSVPPERMVARNPRPMGDPNKIMGLPKPVFWIIVVVGAILAFYLVKKSGSSSNAIPVNRSGDNDWAADDALAAAAEQGMASAGLPNIPGTNGNPNPQTTSAPAPTQDPSSPDMVSSNTGSYYTGPPTYYPAPAPPVYGAGGAYSTGPISPSGPGQGASPGGAITGRGIQGGL